MAEPFEVSTDPAGGVTLAPQENVGPATAVALSPQDVGILPDTAQVLGPVPHLPTPPPPPPPPSPTEDPRQRLAALIALSMAIGQGVRGGGVGALQGFNETQHALRQDQLSRYQSAVQENEKQRQQIEQQQRAAETDYRLRQQSLEKELAQFKVQASQAPDKATYDALAEATGNRLGLMYRTITPDWLRANIPYVKPSQTKLASAAFDAWMKNPNNKKLLDEHPDQAAASMVAVDLNGDGVKENIPFKQLAEAAGHGFAMTAQGTVPVPSSAVKGSSPFDVKYNALLAQFRAENRRDPNPKENNALVDQALEASKIKPQGPEKLIKVEHQDENGNAVTEWLPESEVRGRTFKKPVSGATDSRLVSAKAVNQTGSDIINQIQKNAKILGPILSRYNSVADFVGAPPPEFSRLAGMIESFSIANMGVHGMRSSSGADAIRQSIGLGRHTPESMIATIQGLMGFSTHLLNNEGRSDGAPSSGDKPDPLASAQEKLRNRAAGR